MASQPTVGGVVLSYETKVTWPDFSGASSTGAVDGGVGGVAGDSMGRLSTSESGRLECGSTIAGTPSLVEGVLRKKMVASRRKTTSRIGVRRFVDSITGYRP